jgi:hypothetical protein
MAYLVAHTKPKTASDTDLTPAYPGMTAVDFAGHNDNTWSPGEVSGKFYSPLLDDAGLTGISTNGQTPNILVYAPAETATEGYANKQTYDVLTEHFAQEPVYSYYDTDNSESYKRVASAIDQWGTVVGHLVQSDLTATNDHLLVDKQDFNCPIRYQFDDTHRMWYQRMPDRYVSLTEGWETVSLPFTAELVTTQDKGEITHFYSGSRTIEGSDAKIGHEYWLREYKGGAVDTNDATVFKTTFNYPDAAGSDKQVDNTFLWDYYYSKNTQKDANSDTYQTYYETGRELTAYPLLATAKPYIIGFPGKTYYEFDLSGSFEAKNTASPAPAKLGKQTISFVSIPPGITIAVSDDEQATAAIDDDGYMFVPNYMSTVVTGTSYQMVAAGNQFDKQSNATPVPFRPYFVPGSSSAPATRAAKYIAFDSSDSSFAFDDDPAEDKLGEGVDIRPGKRSVVVTSNLRKTADVRIFNVGGLCIANFNIEPGQTIETPVYRDGVYVVHAAGGRYRTKLAVK